MKIGILSDTHDQVRRTRQAIRQFELENVDAVIHCGDLTIPDVVYACSCEEGVACHFTMGNCDLDRRELRRAIEVIGGQYWETSGEIELLGQRIAFTHGDSPSTFRRLLASQPDYLFYGHTHKQSDRMENGVRVINPGALHRADPYSIAILDLPSRDLRFLNII